MSDMQPSMEVIKVTVLRCPVCNYERRIPGIYDPSYLDLKCPACVGPDKWASWSVGKGAEPVKFDVRSTDGQR